MNLLGIRPAAPDVGTEVENRTLCDGKRGLDNLDAVLRPENGRGIPWY